MEGPPASQEAATRTLTQRWRGWLPTEIEEQGSGLCCGDLTTMVAAVAVADDLVAVVTVVLAAAGTAQERKT